MTKGKKFKSRVRARAEKTGESYQAAHRQMVTQPQETSLVYGASSITPAVTRAADVVAKSIVPLLMSDLSKGFSSDLWVGTGVLAEIGGHHFVLTAGHNLHDYGKNDLVVYFPRKGILVLADRGVPIVRLVEDRVRDVGYIELDATRHKLWEHVKPLTCDNMGLLRDVGEDDRILLCGMPAKWADPKLTPVAQTVMFEGLVVDLRQFPKVTDKRGRIAVPYNLAELPDPEGISGGPLVAVRAEQVSMLGVASTVDRPNQIEWCEPTTAILQLLCEHPVEDVSAAASTRLASLGLGGDAPSTPRPSSPPAADGRDAPGD